MVGITRSKVFFFFFLGGGGDVGVVRNMDKQMGAISWCKKNGGKQFTLISTEVLLSKSRIGSRRFEIFLKSSKDSLHWLVDLPKKLKLPIFVQFEKISHIGRISQKTSQNKTHQWNTLLGKSDSKNFRGSTIFYNPLRSSKEVTFSSGFQETSIMPLPDLKKIQILPNSPWLHGWFNFTAF